MNIYYEDFDWEYEVDEDDLIKAKRKILKTYSIDQLVDIIMDIDTGANESLEDYNEDLIYDLKCEFEEKAKEDKMEWRSGIEE